MEEGEGRWERVESALPKDLERGEKSSGSQRVAWLEFFFLMQRLHF